jgi:Na+-transporting NADH:ubiquinone oxidoreductase subunit C
MGAKVDDPAWKALWPGKQLYDSDWKPTIRLLKGPLNRQSPEVRYQVDALSGATLTTRGVEDLLHFWLGPDGFGPFLTRLREGRDNL